MSHQTQDALVDDAHRLAQSVQLRYEGLLRNTFGGRGVPGGALQLRPDKPGDLDPALGSRVVR